MLYNDNNKISFFYSKDQNEPNHEGKTNRGFSLKKRNIEKKEKRQNTKSVSKSTAGDRHNIQKTKAIQPPKQRTSKQIKKSGGKCDTVVFSNT